MKLHEKLARLIESRGITQRDLARGATAILLKEGRTKLPSTTMNRMFNGEGKPDIYEAAAIAKVLRVPLDYLADDKQDDPPGRKQIDPDLRFLLQTAKRIGYGVAVERLLSKPVEADEPFKR